MSVVEKEGKVIATTEENMIGRQIDAIENFVGSQAEMCIRDRQGTFLHSSHFPFCI